MYTHIYIQKDRFFIVERTVKMQDDFALATLKSIEEVLNKGLQYSRTRDKYSKFGSPKL